MNSRTNFIMHPCANPNFHLPCFTCGIIRELFLRRTMNTYNANGYIVATYLFKDVVKEAEYIKKNVPIHIKNFHNFLKSYKIIYKF